MTACATWVSLGHAETRVVPTASDLRIAAERFDEGRDAFKAGNYAEAAEHFEAADARAPSASALGLAMRSRAEAGQLSRAATLAELLLRRHPDDIELVEKASTIIDSVRPSCGRVAIDCTPDCDLVVDEKLIHGRAADSWTLFLEPGSHAVAANWSRNRMVTEQVISIAGETTHFSFKPMEASPPDPVAPKRAPTLKPLNVLPAPGDSQPKPKGLSPTLFWIGVGMTVAAGGATIWSGIDTLNNPGPEAVRQGCVGLGDSCQLYRQGQNSELRTNVLLGTTAVLAVATTITGIFLTDFSRPRAGRNMGTSHFRIQPWVETRHAAGLSGSANRVGFLTVTGVEGRF